MSDRPKYDKLAWLDLETTGLDPDVADVIEIGICITDLDLNLIASYEITIVPSDSQIEAVHENEYLLKMHTKSGLWPEVLQMREGGISPATNAEIDDLLCDFMSELAAPGSVMLAGSGIAHFDNLFMRRWPEFSKFFTYAMLDVGVVRRALRIFGAGHLNPDIPESSHMEVKAHRALADASAHLQEAQMFQRTLATSIAFDSYQRSTKETAIYPESGTGSIAAIAYCALGLGEAGEVQNDVKKIIRDDAGLVTSSRVDAIQAELGDVLWYVARLADELGLDLQQVAAQNLAKLRSRKSSGTLGAR